MSRDVLEPVVLDPILDGPGRRAGDLLPPDLLAGRERRRLRRARGVAAFVRAVLGMAVAGLLLGLALGAVAVKLGGLQGLSILSGSMTPAFRTGDVVINDRVAPLQARVGDVVTFKDPQSQSRLITHRVRSMTRVGGHVHFVTQGDANDTNERWRVAIDETIGRAVARVPRAGHLLGWLGTPLGRIGFIIVPALVLGTLELVRIWRTGPDLDERDGS